MGFEIPNDLRRVPYINPKHAVRGLRGARPQSMVGLYEEPRAFLRGGIKLFKSLAVFVSSQASLNKSLVGDPNVQCYYVIESMTRRSILEEFGFEDAQCEGKFVAYNGVVKEISGILGMIDTDPMVTGVATTNLYIAILKNPKAFYKMFDPTVRLKSLDSARRFFWQMTIQETFYESSVRSIYEAFGGLEEPYRSFAPYSEQQTTVSGETLASMLFRI